MSKDLFSVVGCAVANKVDELNEIFTNIYLKQAKVRAAFLVHDSESNRFDVVAFATGNQTIAPNKIACNGSTLNDCHAEILARRSFIRFLYLHLLSERDPEKFMFAPADEESNLELKSRFSFHLYISTTPCGDSRIFSISEVKNDKNNAVDRTHEPVFDDVRKHGALRCKIENGSGSVPVFELLESVDDTNGASRLLTMSCSDKILKWNVLGVQGSLLTTFVKPIYLSSITIGSLYHHSHLSRAVCCRINVPLNLPTGYRINHPLLGQFGNNNKERVFTKVRSDCVNWNSMEENIVEIIQSQDGKTPAGLKSRLCRLEFFRFYKKLMKQLVTSGEIVDDLTYFDAKQGDNDYKYAKENFVQAMKSKNYGCWVNKPVQQKSFR